MSKYTALIQENKVFKTIAQVADAKKLESYIIGGYVRDLLLDRPSKDADIVCVGSGIELAKAVAKELDPNLQVNYFKRYGTAMFKYEGFEVEFVGARKESYRQHSRNPVVEDGSLEDDLNRRDFTINTLAIGLNELNRGELLDTFGGVKDLKNGIIQTPLDASKTFSDDPLRMMRAIRFATQLNFFIEEQTFQAIKENAHRLEIISKERIKDELNKIVASPKPSVGFKLLYDTHLLHQFFPEMTDLQGVDLIDGIGHKDNFYHTLQVLDNVAEKSDNLWLRWAAIMHDIAKPATKRFDKKHGWTFHGHEPVGAKWVPSIFKRLKLPQDEKMQYVKKLVALHLRPIALVKDIVTDSAIRRLLFDAGDDIEDLMDLCEADITSKNEEKVERYLNNFKKVRQKLKEVEAKDHIRNWQPPISGEIIMKTFGIKPSREVGDIKDAIKDAILDGEIGNNYEEAYQYMVKKGRELNLSTREEKELNS